MSFIYNICIYEVIHLTSKKPNVLENTIFPKYFLYIILSHYKTIHYWKQIILFLLAFNLLNDNIYIDYYFRITDQNIIRNISIYKNQILTK